MAAPHGRTTAAPHVRAASPLMDVPPNHCFPTTAPSPVDARVRVANRDAHSSDTGLLGGGVGCPQQRQVLAALRQVTTVSQ
jgi:hypothetical protein